MMGADRRGGISAVPATLVVLLLCVITLACAVEGRWAFVNVELIQGKTLR